MSRPTARPARLAASLAFLVGAFGLAACAEDRSASDVVDGESASSEDELNAGPTAWYRLRSSGGSLSIEPVSGGSVRCAGGEESARCAITSVDLRRAVPAATLADARSRLDVLALEDSVLVLGRTSVRPGPSTAEPRFSTMRLLASRVFENVARVSPDGELYQVTRLETPTRCKLARPLPSPRGSLAPPMIETFDGTCEHKATRLVGEGSFEIDQPDWNGGQPQGALRAEAAAASVSTDLAEGDPVIVVGSWVSSDGPLSRPTPGQVWRDMKHILAR